MKIEKWMDAVSTVEDDILEAFVKKDMQLTKQATRYRNPIIRKLRKWTPAIAACLCIAICLSIALQFLPSNAPKHLGKVNLVDRWNEPEKGMYLIKNQPKISEFSTSTQYETGFTGGIAVAAKLIEILPDRYLSTNTYITEKSIPTSFDNIGSHILHFETIETICGNQIPKDFYYLFWGDLNTSLDSYDFFIVEMQQIGLENFLLYNTSSNQY